MQWQKFLASCLVVALVSMGCGGQDDYVIVRTPTEDDPWPESTREWLQTCLDEHAGDMARGEYVIKLDLTVTSDGIIRKLEPNESNIPAPDLETCITHGLRAMTVPAFILKKAPVPLSHHPIPKENRHLLANGTMTLDGAAMEHALFNLGPLVLRSGSVGLVVVVGITVVAAVVWWGNAELTKRCKEEWRRARTKCMDLSEWNDPPRGVTGGYEDVEECAKGLVTQTCGGNRIDENDGPIARPGRRT